MTQKIESFKYKGTPEQMSKVVDWLLDNGFAWWDEREGEYLHVCLTRQDFFYATGYASDTYPKMPPEYALEIFGTTDGITGKPENPWQVNEGSNPFKEPSDTKIQLTLRSGEEVDGKVNYRWDWHIVGHPEDIIKWRYAEKSDEEYFVQPETPSKTVYRDGYAPISVPVSTTKEVLDLFHWSETEQEIKTEKKLTMDEAMDLVIDWAKKSEKANVKETWNMANGSSIDFIRTDGDTLTSAVPVAFQEERIVSFDEAVQIVKDSIPAKAIGPIKSDGGSSDYYKLTIKTKNGSFECETGDVIAAMVGDNFALGNALKALRRIWCAHEGRGKEGIDMAYDAKKINYFVQDFINRSGK